jgi:hypothetical protein
LDSAGIENTNIEPTWIHGYLSIMPEKASQKVAKLIERFGQLQSEFENITDELQESDFNSSIDRVRDAGAKYAGQLTDLQKGVQGYEDEY